MQVLQIHAGPSALQLLSKRRIVPQDVAIIPGAAGGPKGLVLGPLDRFLFGQWLADSQHTIHLLGASIGAWRLATACLADPGEGFRQLSESYVNQRYQHAPGRLPKAAHVSEVFGSELQRLLGGSVAQILGHPRYRLHVFTSRGRHLLGRQGKPAPRLRIAAGTDARWDSDAAGPGAVPTLPAEHGAGLARQGAAPPPSRQRASARLDNVVLISPHPEWIARLPNAKLPDRTDLQRYGDDVDERARVWQIAVTESERLAEAFADWLAGRIDLRVLPLR